METNSSPRLLIIFLLLAISIGGARSRSRLVPEISPTTTEPDAPGASPAPKPAADWLNPDVSNTLQSAAARLGPGVSLDPDELVEGPLANSPDQSVDAEEAAALVSQIDVPAAKELVNGIDLEAALSKVDQNTLKSLSSFM